MCILLPVYDYISVLENGKEVYRFPYAMTTDVRRRFVIEETVIAGRKETVKEDISATGFQVSIKGFIIPEEQNLPHAQIREMQQSVLEAGKTLEIISPRLNNLGIFYMVVTGYKLPAYPGSFAQPFEIDCKSDAPYDVEAV